MNNEKKHENAEAVAEAVSKTDLFFKENRNTILIVLAVLVVAGLAFFFYHKFVYEVQRAEAQEQMYPAENNFRSMEYELALNGDGNVLGFSQIINDYGKKAGKAVYFYAGVCELQLGNSLGEKAVWSFDFNDLSLNLDRSESGRTDFSDKFGKSDIRAKLIKRDRYELRLFVDRQSTELFINDGDVSFTNSIFPNEAYNSLSLTSPDARVSGIKVYRLE